MKNSVFDLRILLCFMMVAEAGSFCNAACEKDNAVASVTFDWKRFGERVRKNMPDKLNSEEDLLRVKYFAQKFADELDKLAIAPNYDETVRQQSREKYNNRSDIGTCGHTSRAFREMLIGSGIQQSRIKLLNAIKVRYLNGRLFPDLSDILNGDHVAVAIVDGNNSHVFDFWVHGRNTRSFKGFNRSIWAGMTQSVWEKVMREKEGYHLMMFENEMNEFWKQQNDVLDK
jgi:hypothetical protein